MNREMLLGLQFALIERARQASDITHLFDFLLNRLLKLLDADSALYLKRDPEELTWLSLTAVVGDDELAACLQQRFNLPQEFDELEEGVARLTGPQSGTVLLDSRYQYGMLLPLGEVGCIILLSDQTMPFDDGVELRDALEAIGGLLSLLESHCRERKRSCDVERRLNEARHQSELTNAAKSEFLTRMSHELRTPLNAILGFTQLFEFDDNLTSRQLDNIKEIERAGYLMLDLVSEVLDLTKIESGRIEIMMEKVLLNSIVDECRSLVLNQAALRDIQLSMCASCDPIYVHADQTRLKQVLINLLSNAVKYNCPGGQVEITCIGVSASRCRVMVTDSGAGIPENKLNELFQPFNRLGVESAGVEGSGMGLVITKKLLELMGGEIGVESQPGVGTTFWFELQTEAKAAEAITDELSHLTDKPQAADQLRILVAEDNPINQSLLRQQLELLGYMADVVPNGQAALEIWRLGKYHCILSDCNMPVMDGYAMTEQIRKQELATQERMPIIAITANVGERERKRCHAAGMDAVLSKPLDIKALGDTLSSLIGGSSPLGEVTELASNEQEQKPPIDSQFLAKLVGGDTALQQRVLAKFLETTPTSIDEIDAAVAAEDSQQLKFVAHRLKSSSRSMGGNAIGECCQSIENAVLDSDWTQVAERQKELHDLWQEFYDYFSQR